MHIQSAFSSKARGCVPAGSRRRVKVAFVGTRGGGRGGSCLACDACTAQHHPPHGLPRESPSSAHIPAKHLISHSLKQQAKARKPKHKRAPQCSGKPPRAQPPSRAMRRQGTCPPTPRHCTYIAASPHWCLSTAATKAGLHHPWHEQPNRKRHHDARGRVSRLPPSSAAAAQHGASHAPLTAASAITRIRLQAGGTWRQPATRHAPPAHPQAAHCSRGAACQQLRGRAAHCGGASGAPHT